MSPTARGAGIRGPAASRDGLWDRAPPASCARNLTVSCDSHHPQGWVDGVCIAGRKRSESHCRGSSHPEGRAPTPAPRLNLRPPQRPLRPPPGLRASSGSGDLALLALCVSVCDLPTRISRLFGQSASHARSTETQTRSPGPSGAAPKGRLRSLSDGQEGPPPSAQPRPVRAPTALGMADEHAAQQTPQRQISISESASQEQVYANDLRKVDFFN